MASFLHVAPGGMRFNGPELGGWYASADLRTAAAEVGHHLRREAMARSLPQIKWTYRSYSAQLEGKFVDVGRARNAMRDGQFFDRLYDPLRYEHAQRFGEAVRGEGGDGIIFDSIACKAARMPCPIVPRSARCAPGRSLHDFSLA